CPPGARCVWSGVEVIEGRWTRRGDRVLLGLDPAARPLAVEPPARLAVTVEDDALVLREDGCRYRRPESAGGDGPAAPAPEPASLPSSP
ncbi:MAG: hypothetical protein R3263_08365, partial [Myxococcota bacterium]|nr:hypothetical protein [Myxococcota bacterium]